MSQWDLRGLKIAHQAAPQVLLSTYNYVRLWNLQEDLCCPAKTQCISYLVGINLQAISKLQTLPAVPAVDSEASEEVDCDAANALRQLLYHSRLRCCCTRCFHLSPITLFVLTETPSPFSYCTDGQGYPRDPVVLRPAFTTLTPDYIVICK